MMEIFLMARGKKEFTGKKPWMLPHYLAICGDCIKCTEMCWSGVKTGMLMIIIILHHSMIPRDLKPGFSVSFAAAVGTATRGTSVPRAGAATTRPTAAGTTASALLDVKTSRYKAGGRPGQEGKQAEKCLFFCILFPTIAIMCYNYRSYYADSFEN